LRRGEWDGRLALVISFGNLDDAKRQMAKACELAEGDDCLKHNPNLSFI
jgi:hypothetical protein